MMRNINIWLAGYFAQAAKRVFLPRSTGLKHIIFCIADHFEPRWASVGPDKELERVDRWIAKYEPVAMRHKDSEGKIPQYTFFYPIDEHTPQVLEKVARFCEKGFGETEIHLHHDNDTEDSLRKKLEHAKDVFVKFGLLGRDKVTTAIKYGFIHGNWALCNSRKDGRWCGVNNELAVLKDTGCYADFTLPSAPSETQTRKINSIYYAKDTCFPKAHNSGINVETGKTPAEGLMLIQGPLALNWKRMKIENGDISLANPPAQDRIRLWVKQGIGVKGRPDWIFIKVYTHGAQDNNLKDAYFENLDMMFSCLEEEYDDGENYKLHYATARQMYNMVKAAEAGESRDPSLFRDYLIVSNIKRNMHA